MNAHNDKPVHHSGNDNWQHVQPCAVGSSGLGFGGNTYRFTNHHTRNASSIQGTGKPLQQATQTTNNVSVLVTVTLMA